HVATSLKGRLEFHFATPKGNKQLTELISQNGFHHKPMGVVEISKSWTIIFYLPLLIYNSWRLLQYIKRNSISIVHVNDLYNMTGGVIKILRPSLKLISHVRLPSGSSAGLLYRFWVAIIGEMADHLIVVPECVKVVVLKFIDS